MAQIPILQGIFTDAGADFRTSLPMNLMAVPKTTGISAGYLRTSEGMIEIRRFDLLRRVGSRRHQLERRLLPRDRRVAHLGQRRRLDRPPRPSRRRRAPRGDRQQLRPAGDRVGRQSSTTGRSTAGRAS